MAGTVKWCLLALVGLIFILGSITLWYSIRTEREAESLATCEGHLCLHATAIQNYHASEGHFPPAFILGPDGKPWHSWRVLILPFIEQNDLYKEYKFDEPWNGPNNSKLHSRMPKHFACPADSRSRAEKRTNYFAVVGPDTVFPSSQTTRIADIARPHGQTILLVETVGLGIIWMEPRNLSFAEMNFETDDRNSPSISSKHRYHNVAFVDGSRRQLNNFSTLELRTMLQIR